MKLKSLIFLLAVSISSLTSCNSTRPAINETGSSANENQESENGTNEDEIEMKQSISRITAVLRKSVLWEEV